MDKYQKNAISCLRAEIKVAKKFKAENDILKYNTVLNMMRQNLSYCLTLGVFNYNKYTLLLKIANNMIGGF